LVDIDFPKYIMANFKYFRFESFNETFMIANPFLMAQTIMTSNVQRYMRWFDQYRDYSDSVALMAFIQMAYIIAGAVFVWRAKCRFRRNIF
jgi:hypothetical protein